eukprot:7581254-Karenia_brevis.AAC.1
MRAQYLKLLQEFDVWQTTEQLEKTSDPAHLLQQLMDYIDLLFLDGRDPADGTKMLSAVMH